MRNQVRASSHYRLRAYEAKRRAAYGTKLTSSSLYWRSFRDLLHSSLEETERAEVLVKGSANAIEAFAGAMKAAGGDALDDDGRPVTDPKKLKKLQEKRERRRAERVGHRGGHHPGEEADRKTTPNSRLGVSSQAFDDAASDKRGGMLRSLVESQGVMGERFSENSKFVRAEVAPEVKRYVRAEDALCGCARRRCRRRS